jgi:L-asparagine transporter-like permease
MIDLHRCMCDAMIFKKKYVVVVLFDFDPHHYTKTNKHNDSKRFQKCSRKHVCSVTTCTQGIVILMQCKCCVVFSLDIHLYVRSTSQIILLHSHLMCKISYPCTLHQRLQATVTYVLCWKYC